MLLTRLPLERIIVSDLPLGTILKLKSAKGTVYRKLYKVNEYKDYLGNIHYSLWGILMDFNSKENRFEEDCGMTSNRHERFTHRVVEVDGQWQHIPIRLVTENQATQEDEDGTTI